MPLYEITYYDHIQLFCGIHGCQFEFNLIDNSASEILATLPRCVAKNIVGTYVGTFEKTQTNTYINQLL